MVAWESVWIPETWKRQSRGSTTLYQQLIVLLLNCMVLLFFSRLDAKSAYWNVELDDGSSYLTTFSTHRGRFRYRRMSYGSDNSQDIFRKEWTRLLKRCKGAIPIADDIQMFGTDDSHDTHLHKAMERIRSVWIKLDFEKCVIKSKSCTFFGNVYIPQGVKTRPQEGGCHQEDGNTPDKAGVPILSWHGKTI